MFLLVLKYQKSTQNEVVRFIQVIFYHGGKKTVRLNQVSALQCPLYGGFSMRVY